VGYDSHFVFGKKFPGGKGYDMVCCHDAAAGLFGAKSLHILTQLL
jgi:hypothetical protein